MILIKDMHKQQNRESLAKDLASYVYIGRKSKYGQPDSVLRNQFTRWKEGSKTRAIEKYRKWLWREIIKKGTVYEELRRLVALTEGANLDLVLLCWCKEEDTPNCEEVACHGDIIRKAIMNWAEIERRLKSHTSSAAQSQSLSHQGKHIHVPDADVNLYPECFSPKESADFLYRLRSEIPWRQDYLNYYGRQVPLPRLTAWYGDPEKAYNYSHIHNRPRLWTELLRTIKTRVEAVSGAEYNSVLLNLYRSGRDSVSWHRDDEPELGDDPIIASLSFGAARVFQMRRLGRSTQQIDLQLTDGSLIVMGRGTQRFWEHRIPKTQEVVEARINLTFRYIY